MARLTALRSMTAVLILVALAACTSIYRNHGYLPPEQDLAQITVGQSTRDDVAALVGRPGTSGVLEGSGWYYVQSRWKHYGPREPQEVDRQVLAISFTPEGVVSNIEHWGLERGRAVRLSQRVTTPNVEGLSVIKQLLSGLGKFNPAGMLGGNQGGGVPGRL